MLAPLCGLTKASTRLRTGSAISMVRAVVRTAGCESTPVDASASRGPAQQQGASRSGWRLAGLQYKCYR